jgi:hypothetical protein
MLTADFVAVAVRGPVDPALPRIWSATSVVTKLLPEPRLIYAA